MPKTRPPYPAVFRQQMVEFVRAGRAPEDLAREFEPSVQAIRNWVTQAGRDAGERADGLRTEEVKSFAGCGGTIGGCAKNAKFYQKPRPGSRGRPDPGGLPVHERESGPFPYRHDGPRARCLAEWVLHVASASTVGSRGGRCGPDGPRASDSQP